MDFFEAVAGRRSIRPFGKTAVPESVMQRAFEAAVLAPNSSNLQTWDFYWVRTPERLNQLRLDCLNQAAARTAQELVVVTADPARWRRAQPPLLEFVRSVGAPPSVARYYEDHIPKLYRLGPHWTLLRWLSFTWEGLKRSTMRGPLVRRDHEVIALKSAALACQNFVLAVTAQGFDTCMMEGFDPRRVRKHLGLPRTARIVMVIAVGKAPEPKPGATAPGGTWGPRFRLPLAEVVHRL